MTEFYGQGNPVLEGAFRDCVLWAYGDSEMRSRFETEAGKRLPESGMDALIDEATGHEEVLLEAFVAWVAKNLWGRDDD
jgi:hypothetical protein